jgi:hypothetical protein
MRAPPALLAASLKIAVIGKVNIGGTLVGDGGRPGTRWCAALGPTPDRGQVAPR